MNNRVLQLKQWLQESPNDAFINHALGLEYMKVNALDKALQHFMVNRTHNPDYVGTYYHLAKLYEQQQAFDKAIDTYEAGIKIAAAQGDHHNLSELRSALDQIID
jgi:Tfp pilus assembly protein PilF